MWTVYEGRGVSVVEWVREVVRGFLLLPLMGSRLVVGLGEPVFENLYRGYTDRAGVIIGSMVILAVDALQGDAGTVSFAFNCATVVVIGAGVVLGVVWLCAKSAGWCGFFAAGFGVSKFPAIGTLSSRVAGPHKACLSCPVEHKDAIAREGFDFVRGDFNDNGCEIGTDFISRF